jgi:hypothetical protein
MVGGQSLHRPHRVPVVAELSVVVVLDHEPTRVRGPLDDGRTAGGCQCRPERELVCGGEDHGGLVGKRLDRGAPFVDRQRHRAEAGANDDLPNGRQAMALDRHRATGLFQQDGAEQGETLPEAGAHDDPVRVGAHSASACEVAGEGLPELGPAPRVAVAERRHGSSGQAAAHRARPGGGREGREIGRARPQVVTRVHRGPGLGVPWRIMGLDAPGDAGARTLTRDQPALGDQLTVGVGHGVAGQPQVGGELPR